ncbi:hypothetical protein B5X24_HaOG215510 [Helicoverpa armigera]|nr:hypothetical protein B5X24_HaOG215510 [Helicoverpa armigera]
MVILQSTQNKQLSSIFARILLVLTRMMHVYLKWIRIKSVYCFVLVILIFVLCYLYNTSYLKKTKLEAPCMMNTPFATSTTEIVSDKSPKPRTKTKFILLWTNPNTYPFLYFGEGNDIFKKKKCEYVNCVVTSNRRLLRALTEFHIVVFNGPQLGEMMPSDDIPMERSFRQKYVYANIEAAVNYPICRNTWNNFFNWTWTYKLNSDAVWGYIVITNTSNHVIGPKENMDWMSVDDMKNIDNDLKLKLASKHVAAAWFVSNCNTLSKREFFFNELQTFMSYSNLKADVYGSCGSFQCPKSIMYRCHDELQRKYYFYLAFENALSEDYVSEKILHALNHYTVPVVYGGADYSRFLPPGSYLDAKKLGARNLAKEMSDIIDNPEIYYRFFRWRNHYNIRSRYESPDTDDYCRFCAMANDENLMKKKTIYENFSSWWTPEGFCLKR